MRVRVHATRGRDGDDGMAGAPINRSAWPVDGPHLRLLRHLDRVHTDGGRKSLRAVGTAIFLSHSTLSDILRGRRLPASEKQIRAIIKALGGGTDEMDRAAELYQRARTGALREAAAGPAVAARPSGPFELPPRPAALFGRSDHIRSLSAALLSEADGRPPIVAISGKPGVGKSALALAVAHDVAGRFPDGALHANLQGQSDRPASIAGVLRGFLIALGVEAGAVPRDLDGRLRMFRRLTAAQSLLIVLDNARNAADANALIPSGASSSVLVTSREVMSVLDAANFVRLEVLHADDAVALLAHAVGKDRAEREPRQLDEMARVCGFLPLALRIAGARLASKPHWQVTEMATLLRDQRRAMDEFRVGDLEVRGSFNLSYVRLSASAQRTFRLLALVDAGSMPAWAAGAMTNAGTAVATRDLEELVDAELIEVSGRDGVAQVRYAFHDLIRVFAKERALREELPDERRKAVERLLTTATAITRRALYGGEPAGRPEAQMRRTDHRAESSAEGTETVSPELRLAEEKPLAWFTAEQQLLVHLVAYGREFGFDQEVVDLVHLLPSFFEVTSSWSEWEETHNIAIELTRATGDPVDLAIVLRDLSRAATDQGAWLRAEELLRDSIRLFLDAGESTHEAIAYRELGRTYLEQQRWREAERSFADALAIFTRAGEQRHRAITLRGLVVTHLALGEDMLARGELDEALGMLSAIGDAHGVAICHRLQGDLDLGQGRLDDAAAHYLLAAEGFVQFHDERRHVEVLERLGRTRERQGQAETARKVFQEALAIADRRSFEREMRRLSAALSELS